MMNKKETIMLDPGPTPLYLQLRSILEAKILSQEFKENERFPTEAELCEQFRVSRATVLRALEGLLRVGLIYSDRGRGTFVAQGAGLMNPALKGSIHDLIMAGKGIRLKVLSYKEVPVPQSLSDTFRPGESGKVFLPRVRPLRPRRPSGLLAYLLSPRSGQGRFPRRADRDH